MASNKSENSTAQNSARDFDGIVTDNISDNQRQAAALATEPVSEKQIEPPPQSHFSTWSHRQKLALVIMVSCFGFFSPLSANIYYPVFNTLAEYYKVNNTLINLTVTTYMIFQGISPTLIAGVSDGAGRRPAFILCFVIYLGANIGLALQHNYAALLVLRMLQSLGSSSTIALCTAVVADIATSAERGKFTAIASSGQYIGPGIGPIIGGLLANFIGWRSVFWFLVISGGVCLVFMVIFYPDTCRKLVGDGSIPPVKWNIPPAINKIKITNPLLTLYVIFEMEVGLILIAVAISYGSYYAVISSIPSQFAEIYGYNDIQIALCFIPIGAAAMVAVLGEGKAVDLNYRRYAKKLGFPLVKTKQTDLRNFPIEKPRLEVALPLLTVQALATFGYGWTIHYNTNLAGPLIFLFFMTTAAALSFTIMSILLIDLYPESPGTVSAANNLTRCWLGAGATVAIIPLIDAIGRGWSMTFFGFLCMVFTPVLIAVMKWGPEWREQRRLKVEAKKEKDMQQRGKN